MKLKGKKIRKSSETYFLFSEINEMRLEELPTEAREWYEKFLLEYYVRQFEGQPLHSEEQKKELRRACYRSFADFLNASPEKIVGSQEKNGRHSCYDASDYRPSSSYSDVEKILLELIEKEN